MVGESESGVPVQRWDTADQVHADQSIFRQELLHVYEQKSKSRDELVVAARKAMLELAKAMREMTCTLGHYDAGFTLRTYTHATRQKQDEAAQTMGSFMAQVM